MVVCKVSVLQINVNFVVFLHECITSCLILIKTATLRFKLQFEKKASYTTCCLHDLDYLERMYPKTALFLWFIPPIPTFWNLHPYQPRCNYYRWFHFSIKKIQSCIIQIGVIFKYSAVVIIVCPEEICKHYM